MGAFKRIGIIMRTKDRVFFLERALASVINQSYKDWILVIVNDGGDIHSVRQLLDSQPENIKEKINLINIEDSKGMENASNVGLESCKNIVDYIVIHDDDDTWKENFLYECVNFFENNPKCMGVVTQINQILEYVKDENIKFKKNKGYKDLGYGLINILELYNKNIFPPISFIYKSEVLDVIGTYNTNLPVLGDWEFNLRFITHFDIYILDMRLANYHIRMNKTGSSANSIIAKRKYHEFYKTQIFNDLLRIDIQNGKIGSGTVVAITRALESISLFNQLKIIYQLLRKLIRK